MTFSAANLRLRDIPPGLFAEGIDLHAFLKEGEEWARHFHAQFHVLAGVGPRNIRHRAGSA